MHGNQVPSAFEISCAVAALCYIQTSTVFYCTPSPFQSQCELNIVRL